MKLLHTSDWHLGHTLYDYDRTDEQKAMLRQIADIVEANRPDLFLLSGDVFHVSQPSASASKMFSDALVDIHDACPEMTIVITAGNHDSPTRHDVFRTPWKRMNIHMVGSLDLINLRQNIIEIKDKGYVIAVPYTHERNMPENFIRKLLDLTEEMNKGKLPVILSAHTTVKGCDTTGHESISDFTAGGIDGVSLDTLGTGYDYLALGHIHRAQFIRGSKNKARYSGSPLAVSFDEAYPHSVSLVEICNHGNIPLISEIEIKNIKPLISIPATGFLDLDNALRLLDEVPDEKEAYLRLNVEVDDFLPSGALHKALQLTEKKSARFCYINVKRKERAATLKNGLSVSEFKAKNPLEIARRYTSFLDIDFTEEMEKMFDEVMKQIDD